MTKSALRRIGQATGSYAVLVVALHFIIGSWIAPIAWGAISLLILGYAFNSVREILINKAILQTYKDEMENIADQMVANVNCAFCSKPNAVRVHFNMRNEFECQHCGKPNLLIVDTTTAQITVPYTESLNAAKEDKS